MVLADIMPKIKNDADKEFFQRQRENVFSCSMAGVHLILVEKTQERECKMKKNV